MSKVMSMAEAVRRFVADGQTLYLAGFTHLMPFAAAHEIIRQRRRDLVLCRATPDLLYEQMIAAGCARKAVFSYAGNPGLGSLRAFRRAVESGALEIEEYTHYGMVARLYAGATRLPFMPLRTHGGSDLPVHNPLIRSVRCPYTGEDLSVVPALRPDVAIIHAQRADPDGNTHIWGLLGDARDAAFAASTVIVVVEEVTNPEVIRSDPNRTAVPGFLVSAVVEEPWGAHPSYVQGYHDRDNDFFITWEALTQDQGGLERWLAEWVYGVGGRREYVAKLGVETILRLRGQRRYAAPVDYGWYP